MKIFRPPPILQRVLDSYHRGRYGDLVHELAQPIARTIDRLVGTELQHCGDCDERRRRWNGDSPAAASDTPPQSS